MNYMIKELGLGNCTDIDSTYDAIILLLTEASNDPSVEWLSTQDIIDYIGLDYGNHVGTILRVMYRNGKVLAATALNSAGYHCHVYKLYSIPF